MGEPSILDVPKTLAFHNPPFFGAWPFIYLFTQMFTQSYHHLSGAQGGMQQNSNTN